MRRILLIGALLGLSACAGGNGRPATGPDTVGGKSAKAKISAAQLLGQNGTWLRAKMGEPAFVRTDRDANLWQYKNSHCVLNVFLYREGDGTPARVLHFDARDATGDNTARDACLSALQD